MIDSSQADKLSDEELAVLALQNRDYFIFIINRYKIKLFNFIKRITNVRDEDAEDLLQEIFLKIYLNLNDFDNDLKFSSWVYSIARNHAISHHRKMQARAEGHSEALGDAAAKSIIADFQMEKNMDLEFLKQRMAEALSNLDEKYREVLVLKFLEEKNYQEISDIIKRPTGTVGSLLNKAKKEFRRELEKDKIN